jgi:Ca-activated chloride channel family protein
VNSTFEFQFPPVLALLALLPLYAFLLGRVGPEAALSFSSGEIIARLGSLVRSSAGRLLAFLRLGTIALAIIALAGPAQSTTRQRRKRAVWISSSSSISHGR